jgi:adenosylcobinamide-GDP ribazoletransferase
VTGLVLAVRYLTIVPVPGGVPHGMQTLGRAAPWFPVVGLALGIVLVGVDRLTAVFFSSLLATLLTVTAWKALTGGLHLDGLADCLDGLAGRDAADRLRIMHDGRLGAFGAIGLVLFLLLEVAALVELPADARRRARPRARRGARATPPLLARYFPPARAEGHGATFREGLRAGAAPLVLTLGVAVAVAALGVVGLALAVVSVVAALALAAFMMGRLAGVTGDVLGAAIEVAELAGLLTVAAWAHVRP